MCPSWGHQQGQQLRGNRHHQRVLSVEFSVICCTFEGHACVHMGVWNEGGLTDGGGQIVSGQYHHGPASPNIIWVLNCVFFFVCYTLQQRVKEREKADGVYVKAEDLKGWGGDEWKVSDR